MATTQELVLKISADVAAANQAVARLSGELKQLQKQASLKPDLSLDNVRAQFSRGIAQLRENFHRGMEDVSTGVLGQLATNLGTLANPAGAAAAGVAALGTALKVSITSAIDFEKALTDVGVITGLSGGQLEALGETAKDLATKFGGDVTAQTQLMSQALSMLGPQLADNREAFGRFLENVNQFAKAAGVDAAQAGQALMTVMLQMGVNVNDANEVAAKSAEIMDAMSKGAQVGAATVSQVAEAMTVAGSTAKTLGISVVEANAAIQALAKAGRMGSEAGVSLRNIMVRLVEGSNEARDALAAAGISFDSLRATLRDRGLGAALEQLKAGLERLPDVTQRAATMAKLFGTENVAAAGGLLANVDAMKQFAAEIGNAQGATAEQAATRMASFDELISRVKASIQVLAINVGGFLVGAVQGLLGVLQPVGDAIAQVWNALKAAIATTSDASGAMSVFVGVLRVIGDALATNIGAAFSVIGSAIGYVVNLVRTFYGAIGEAVSGASGLGSAGDLLRRAFTAVRDAVIAIVPILSTIGSIIGRVAGLIVGSIVSEVVRMVTNAINVATAIGRWLAGLELVRAMVAYVKLQFDSLVRAVQGVYEWLAKLLGLTKDQKASTDAVSKATEQTAAATQQAAVATEQAARATTDWAAAAARLERLSAAVRDYNSIAPRLLELQSRERAIEQGLLEVPLADQIAERRKQYELISQQVLDFAKSIGASSVATRILGTDLSEVDVDTLAREFVEMVPAVRAAREEMEAAGDDVDKAAKAKEKYAQAVARAHGELRTMLLGLKQLQVDLKQLDLKAAVEMASKFGQQLGKIEIEVTPQIALDENAAKQALEPLRRIVTDIQAALATETRPAVRETLEKALKDAQAKLASAEKQINEERKKALEERAQLLIEAIANDEERERASQVRRLEQERDTLLEKARIYGLTQEQIAAIAERFNKRIAAAQEVVTREQIARNEALAESYKTLFDLPAQAASALAEGGEQGMKKFKEVVLAALLDIAEANLAAAIFGVTAQELSTKGIVGLGTAAIGISLLRALFAAAKAAVQRGFKVGGWTGVGDTSDVAGVVHKREFVVRAPYAERWRPLLEAINVGASPMQHVRVHVDGGIALRMRDGWIDAPRYVRLRARAAV